MDSQPNFSADLPRTRPRRGLRTWLAVGAALVAAVAAALVIVPRVTGDGPEAVAASNSWRASCADKLSGGTITRKPVRGGWSLSCTGMEVYTGKTKAGGYPFCVGLYMHPIFISDGEFNGVVDVAWDPYRGWNTQGGREAAGPGGVATAKSQLQAAGALIGKRADGSVAWDHQYGTDVRNNGVRKICSNNIPNP